MTNKLIQKFIRDVKLELDDEFDRNFERKAFFDKAWKPTSLTNSRGSLMMRTGALRASINSTATEKGITWHSSLPYASLHNEGGEITVTEKMKAFFWAMHLKTAGAAKGKGARAQRFSVEAAQWKALALKKVGSKIKVEQRQFIGDHPQVRRSIEAVWNGNLGEFEKYINNVLKKK